MTDQNTLLEAAKVQNVPDLTMDELGFMLTHRTDDWPIGADVIAIKMLIRALAAAQPETTRTYEQGVEDAAKLADKFFFGTVAEYYEAVGGKGKKLPDAIRAMKEPK